MGAVVSLLSREQQRQQVLWRRTVAARQAFTIHPTQATAQAAEEATQAFLSEFLDDTTDAAVIAGRFQAWQGGFREGRST